MLTAAVAGCTSAHPSVPTRVEAVHVTRTVGCSGWFEVTGRALHAHLVYIGDVRSVTVSATFDDGSALDPQPSIQVGAGVTAQTVRVSDVTHAVTAAHASVRSGSGALSSCSLGNPH